MGPRARASGRASTTGRTCTCSGPATVLGPQRETADRGQPHGVENDHPGILPSQCDDGLHLHGGGGVPPVAWVRKGLEQRDPDSTTRSPLRPVERLLEVLAWLIPQPTRSPRSPGLSARLEGLEPPTF